jgi:hypothetical protein
MPLKFINALPIELSNLKLSSSDARHLYFKSQTVSTSKFETLLGRLASFDNLASIDNLIKHSVEPSQRQAAENNIQISINVMAPKRSALTTHTFEDHAKIGQPILADDDAIKLSDAVDQNIQVLTKSTIPIASVAPIESEQDTPSQSPSDFSISTQTQGTVATLRSNSEARFVSDVVQSGPHLTSLHNAPNLEPELKNRLFLGDDAELGTISRDLVIATVPQELMLEKMGTEQISGETNVFSSNQLVLLLPEQLLQRMNLVNASTEITTTLVVRDSKSQRLEDLNANSRDTHRTDTRLLNNSAHPSDQGFGSATAHHKTLIQNDRLQNSGENSESAFIYKVVISPTDISEPLSAQSPFYVARKTESDTSKPSQADSFNAQQFNSFGTKPLEFSSTGPSNISNATEFLISLKTNEELTTETTIRDSQGRSAGRSVFYALDRKLVDSTLNIDLFESVVLVPQANEQRPTTIPSTRLASEYPATHSASVSVAKAVEQLQSLRLEVQEDAASIPQVAKLGELDGLDELVELDGRIEWTSRRPGFYPNAPVRLRNQSLSDLTLHAKSAHVVGTSHLSVTITADSGQQKIVSSEPRSPILSLTTERINSNQELPEALARINLRLESDSRISSPAPLVTIPLANSTNGHSQVSEALPNNTVYSRFDTIWPSISKEILMRSSEILQLNSTTITLDLQDHGKLRIELDLSKKFAQATFVADDQLLRQAIYDGLPKLKGLLTQAGLALHEIHITDTPNFVKGGQMHSSAAITKLDESESIENQKSAIDGLSISSRVRALKAIRQK